MYDKKSLTEHELRVKCITPAIAAAGWDVLSPLFREEYPITKGRIIAKAQVCKRDRPSCDHGGCFI